jgi:hypothetical protein
LFLVRYCGYCGCGVRADKRAGQSKTRQFSARILSQELFDKTRSRRMKEAVGGGVRGVSRQYFFVYDSEVVAKNKERNKKKGKMRQEN